MHLSAFLSVSANCCQLLYNSCQFPVIASIHTLICRFTFVDFINPDEYYKRAKADNETDKKNAINIDEQRKLTKPTKKTTPEKKKT